MKKLLCIATILLSFVLSAIAQVSINRDNSYPDQSAGLDVKFHDKGFLPPRVTHVQMDSIVNPANGLMVYCTDCTATGGGALAMFIDGAWYIFTPTCIDPSKTIAGSHIASQTHIVWNWSAVVYATGYKWNNINNYDSAQDLGLVTTKDESGLNCNTAYTRYIWTYNTCGHSVATQLTASTLSQAPDSPTAGSNIPAQTQITWKWMPIPGISGYKWNNSNSYGTAMDLGNNTTHIQSGLTCDSIITCYIWAYNTCVHSAALLMSQSTLPCSFSCGQPFTDNRNGKTYNTISTGTQCWMKENLNIGVALNQYTGQTIDGGIEKYCYDDNLSNCDIYGGLYQWGEAVQYINGASNLTAWNPAPSGSVVGVCPNGWHIPSSAELDYMDGFLGGPSVAGGKLKEAGTVHWASPNTGATNSSNFTALPGGLKPDVYFYNLTHNGIFWIADEYNGSNAFYYSMDYQSPFLSIGSYTTKATGCSVRCIKDTCGQGPATPGSGTHLPTPTQIIWYWNSVPGALGYKWNNTDSYSTATDMGQSTTTTENGLVCNTSYTRYVWAYNDCGISMPLTLNQSTTLCSSACGQPFTDPRDGKSYNTILIGNQCWMRENMNIGIMMFSQVAQTNNGTIEKYCYDEAESYCSTYGGLYQWGEAVQYLNGTSNSGTWNPAPTGNVVGICPAGWHIPSISEWDTLATYLGGYNIAGGKMKESGTSHWSSPNTGATNSSFFTALPGGQKPNVYYYNIWQYGYFRAAAESGPSQALSLSLNFQGVQLNTVPNDAKVTGYSVRCLKN